MVVLSECAFPLFLFIPLPSVSSAESINQSVYEKKANSSVENTHTRARTHTHTHARTHAHTRTCSGQDVSVNCLCSDICWYLAILTINCRPSRRAHARARTHTHTRARAHTHTQTHTHTRARAHTHTHTHTFFSESPAHSTY